MNKHLRNYLILFCIIAAVLSWSIITIIDLSLTIDYQSQEMALVKEKCKILEIISNIAKDEITKLKIEKYLETSGDKHSYFTKGTNHVVIDGVSLYFSENTLKKIEAGVE